MAVDGAGDTTNWLEATDANRLGGSNGKIFYRGGLSSSWGGNKSNGHIFKITNKVGVSGTTQWLEVFDAPTLSQYVQVGGIVKARLRTWVFVKKGYIGFASHAGFQGDIRLSVGDHGRLEAKEEWQFIDIEWTYFTGNPLYRGITIGTDFDVSVEAYMVAPLITVSTASTDGRAYIA